MCVIQALSVLHITVWNFILLIEIKSVLSTSFLYIFFLFPLLYSNIKLKLSKIHIVWVLILWYAKISESRSTADFNLRTRDAMLLLLVNVKITLFSIIINMIR